MRKLSKSVQIYILLVIVLAVSNVIQVLLPAYQDALQAAASPMPLWIIALVSALTALIFYGGLGLLGLILARKLGFADIRDEKINNRQRFLVPALIGAALGVFLILADQAFAPFNGIGELQHPGFPSSIFASLSAGIGEEIIFRLFFISFWVWIISRFIFKGRWQNTVFWVMAAVSAVVFSAGHLPTVMILYKVDSLASLSPVLYLEILILNSAVSMFAAYYMRKYGFLAAVGIHFWTDIVWHVIWGLL